MTADDEDAELDESGEECATDFGLWDRLLAGLNDDSTQTRLTAAAELMNAIQRLPDDYDEALHGNDDFQYTRWDLVYDLGDHVPMLLHCLRQPYPEIREAAAGTLAALQWHDLERVLPLALDLLQDSHPPVRISIWHILTDLSLTTEQSATLIRHLRENLLHSARELSRAAACALGDMAEQLGDEAGEVISDLLHVFIRTADGPDYVISGTIKKIVTECAVDGRVPEEVIVPLVESLRNPSPEVRSLAAKMFSYFTTKDWTHKVTPRLVELLNDEQAIVRREAAGGLANHLRRSDSEQLSAALPEVGRHLQNDPNTLVRYALILAVRSIPEGAPLLLSALRDPINRVRELAAKHLAKLASEQSVEGCGHTPEIVSRDTFDILRATMRDPLWPVKTYVMAALTAWFGDHPDTLMTLLENVRDDHYRVRQSAIECLGTLHRDPERVVPVLIDALQKDEHHPVRQHALRALDQFVAQFPPAIEGLHIGCRDSVENVSRLARRLLSRRGINLRDV